MTRYFAVYSVMVVVVSMAATAFSQDFGQGARRDLLRRIETNDLPQGKPRLAVENASWRQAGGALGIPPAGRNFSMCSRGR